MSTHPILWFVRLPTALTEHLPNVEDADLRPGFGDGYARRLKSWGHDDSGVTSVHWLATRSGTLMHTDIAYLRYTHHLVLRNDGFKIVGDGTTADHPPMLPGSLYCLDTHTKHQVIRDDRITTGRPRYKVQIAVDRDDHLNLEQAWMLLSPWRTRNPAPSLLNAGLPPRPRKK